MNDPNLFRHEVQPKIELHYIWSQFMVNSKALFFPRQDYSPQQARVVRTRISAIELVAGHDSRGRLGTITQLPQNARLEICGDGFNERTVKVRCKNSFYFVFRDDVEVVAAKN